MAEAKSKKGKTEEITKKATSEEEKEFKSSGIEGEKKVEATLSEDPLRAAADDKDARIKQLEEENKELKEKLKGKQAEKTYVTGEDVIKNLRGKGYSI